MRLRLVPFSSETDKTYFPPGNPAAEKVSTLFWAEAKAEYILLPATLKMLTVNRLCGPAEGTVMEMRLFTALILKLPGAVFHPCT